MKIKEILSEGLSDVLYHLTSLIGAYKILQSGVFKLSIATDIEPELKVQKKDKTYYLSTARSKVNAYSQNHNFADVVFVLDGRRIGQKYSGKAVNYWYSEWVSSDTQESEDRIYSNKNTMPVDYVTEMHVYVKGTDRIKTYSGYLRSCYLLAKKNNIKFFFYTDSNDWLIQNKNKAVKLSEFKHLLYGSADSNVPSQTLNTVDTSMLPIEELVAKNKSIALSKRASNLLYELTYHFSPQTLKTIKYDLTNNRTPAHSYYSSVARINDYMIKNNIKNYDDLLKHLSDKWKEIKNKEKN